MVRRCKGSIYNIQYICLMSCLIPLEVSLTWQHWPVFHILLLLLQMNKNIILHIPIMHHTLWYQRSLEIGANQFCPLSDTTSDTLCGKTDPRQTLSSTDGNHRAPPLLDHRCGATNVCCHGKVTYYSSHQVVKAQAVLGNHRPQHLSHGFGRLGFQAHRSVNRHQIQSKNRRQKGNIYSLHSL